MEALSYRLAQAGDKPELLHFLHTFWDGGDPFADDPVLFRYYFEKEDGGLRFALAECGGKIAALAGFIPASSGPMPDVWVSFWLADPAVRGAGLELMAALPGLLGCRGLACNNIRPKTRVFYEFLGFSTGRVGHFYRLADKKEYRLATVGRKEILPAGGAMRLCRLQSAQELHSSGFNPPGGANPQKDLAYIAKRYFAYPGQSYEVYAACGQGEGPPAALLATRTIAAAGTAVLRIADYIGEAALLPQMGAAIDALMREKNAEYADFYCAGIAAETLAKAGFSHREEGDDTNILPNYLNPPLAQNTEYYYFTSQPQNFRLCKADGDQDRPRTALTPPHKAAQG